jgi:hypothetical protein
LPTFAVVVAIRVNNNRPANHRVLSPKAHLSILERNAGMARLVGNHIAQITDMAILIVGTAVLLAKGIEVRPSADAAVGVVAEFMDVEAMWPRLQSLDIGLDDGGTLARLREPDGSLHCFIAKAAKNTHCMFGCHSRLKTNASLCACGQEEEEEEGFFFCESTPPPSKKKAPLHFCPIGRDFSLIAR